MSQLDEGLLIPVLPFLGAGFEPPIQTNICSSKWN